MPSTDKTRKLLWGRSGSLCAFCKGKLIYSATKTDNESVVGDECHIVSRRRNGPRFVDDCPTDEIDAYRNLILLCKVHHKLVDDQPETFAADQLRRVKANHEKWVSERLSKVEGHPNSERQFEDEPDQAELLPRLNSGGEILAIVAGAYQFAMSNDEPETDVEMRLIGGLLQEVQDYGELYPDLGAGERVEGAYELSRSLKEIEAAGWWMFGTRQNLRRKIGQGPAEIWPTGTIRVMRSTNPTIIKVDVQETKQEESK